MNIQKTSSSFENGLLRSKLAAIILSDCAGLMDLNVRHAKVRKYGKWALWQNLWVKRGKTPLDFDRRVARAEAQKPPLCSF
jgi:hypothetical protein